MTAVPEKCSSILGMVCGVMRPVPASVRGAATSLGSGEDVHTEPCAEDWYREASTVPTEDRYRPPDEQAGVGDRLSRARPLTPGDGRRRTRTDRCPAEVVAGRAWPARPGPANARRDL